MKVSLLDISYVILLALLLSLSILYVVMKLLSIREIIKNNNKLSLQQKITHFKFNNTREYLNTLSYLRESLDKLDRLGDAEDAEGLIRTTASLLCISLPNDINSFPIDIEIILSRNISKILGDEDE